MKKFIAVLLIVSFLLMSCGQNKLICMDHDGKRECHEYSQYGIFDQDENKNPNVKYQLIWGNVIWAGILCETVVVPIVIAGWYLFEPVGKKLNPGDPDSNGVIE